MQWLPMILKTKKVQKEEDKLVGKFLLSSLKNIRYNTICSMFFKKNNNIKLLFFFPQFQFFSPPHALPFPQFYSIFFHEFKVLYIRCAHILMQSCQMRHNGRFWRFLYKIVLLLFLFKKIWSEKVKRDTDETDDEIEDANIEDESIEDENIEDEIEDDNEISEE